MLCNQHFGENREKNFLQKTPFLFISENENSYELNQQLDMLSYFFLLHKLCSMFGIPFYALTVTMRYFIASHFLQIQNEVFAKNSWLDFLKFDVYTTNTK